MFRSDSLTKALAVAALCMVAMLVAACSTRQDPVPDTPTPAPGATEPAATHEPTQEPTETRPTPTVPPVPSRTRVAVSDRIAIASADGSIYLINPDGSDRRLFEITDPGIPGAPFAAFYAWPTWSPDGQHILVSAFTPDFSGGYETSLLRLSAASPNSIPDLLFRDVAGTTGIGGIPHFPLWRPDGHSVALIANVGDGLSTFLVDVQEGVATNVSNGAPVYLDWSADGSHLLVHTAERLVLHDFDEDGGRTGSRAIGSGSISYRVPKFSPAGDTFAFVDFSEGSASLFAGESTDGNVRRLRPARAASSMAWSPVGDRLAFADGGRSGFYQYLNIFDLDETPTDDVVVETPILAFWWSPDGQSILIAMPGGEPENVALAVVDAATGDVNLLGLIAPSAEMGFVIGFFDQYAADLRLWSPDSTRIVFSGELGDGLADPEAGTQIQLGDSSPNIWVIDPSGTEPPISLGAGGFGAWSPN